MSGSNAVDAVLQNVIGMPRDRQFCQRVATLGLNVVNVMWEDTARTPGSVWGDNISDMTLQVRHPNRPGKKELLPVIRYPNFTDRTGDVPFDRMKLKVGNEKGEALQAITLRDYLTNLSNYISYPSKYHADSRSLITANDTHVLISAQACFLPLPASGKCSFNPVLFNYQSRPDSPAVLAVLISPEGSSATVIDNSSDRAEWGQTLYFNHNGQKTCLTGERLSDYKDNQAQVIAAEQGISLEAARSHVSVAQDMNLVMIVQVPLKQKVDKRERFALYASAAGGNDFTVARACAMSDMEDAVIGHGDDEGEHSELGGYKLERDDRYPIRVTVQFYKATSNGVVDDQDLANIRQCIEAAYLNADYIGSLVVSTLEKGALGLGEARPTQPAPAADAIVAPPKDYLEVVNPFAPHQQPTTGQ